MTPQPHEIRPLKAAVRDHWSAEPCGTRVYTGGGRRAYFDDIEQHRYAVEPHIHEFAQFTASRGLRVLEIGVGAGTDHMQWLRAGAVAFGIDLTQAAVALTSERARMEGLVGRLSCADAEALPFPDNSFDIVYSYGVLHHTPDTPTAILEVHRVLRPAGIARMMVYHRPSVVGFVLWLLYGVGSLRPWRSPRSIIFEHLESPGTKVYTCAEARQLFGVFKAVSLCTKLGTGDLLTMRPSQKYRSRLARVAWTLYPRWLVKLAGDRFGLGLLITAQK